MLCIICEKVVKGRDAEHIALDKHGDPVVMCDECYDKVLPFFEEVKPDGEINT